MIQKLNIAICDDDPATTYAIEDHISSYKKHTVHWDVYNDSERLLKNILKDANHYDLFILDIDMPKYNGIQLAEAIRRKNLFAYIIFLTNHQEYMPEVFRFQTFDYLLKPISEEAVHTLIDKISTMMQLATANFSFISKGVQYSLEKRAIAYFEKRGRYAVLHDDSDATFSTIISTKELLGQLDEHFVQIHTSYIVNIAYICGMKFDTVILRLPDKQMIDLPISRKFQKSARSIISKNFSARY